MTTQLNVKRESQSMQASDQTVSFIANLAEVKKQSHDPKWLSVLRQNALEQFLKEGIPTTKDEEWKYTNVTGLSQCAFRIDLRPNTTINKAIERYCANDEVSLVFINGSFIKNLSKLAGLPSGIKISSLKDLLTSSSDQLQKFMESKLETKKSVFAALNMLTFQDGAYIQIEPKTIFEKPIHIVHITKNDKPVFVASRTLIDAGKSSEVTIIESHLSENEAGSYFTCPFTEVHVDENAIMHYTKAQTEAEQAYHINETHVTVLRNSVFDGATITTRGMITRNNLNIVINGEGADAHLNGLYSLYGKQLVDNHTSVAHNVPNCTSNQLYKGILNGASHGVFNGKIYVHPIAQKTNSYQLNKNVLIGADCRIDTKPQLEIFADDVKCTHGAAIGQLNADEIFYLQTRAISKQEATKMLAHGFAEDLINIVKHPDVRQKLHILLEPSFKQL